MDIYKCPFCEPSKQELSDRIIATGPHFYSIYDAYPVSPGHALIVANRHIASIFEIYLEEQEALFSIIKKTKSVVDAAYHPNSYNIGLNDGQAAGQTVHHLHIHLIPRYDGDMDDPRGGVRLMFPDKAKYWSEN